jgi:hypothetical protein
MTRSNLLLEHHLRLLTHAALDQRHPSRDLVDALQVVLTGLGSRHRLREKDD